MKCFPFKIIFVFSTYKVSLFVVKKLEHLKRQHKNYKFSVISCGSDWWEI